MGLLTLSGCALDQNLLRPGSANGAAGLAGAPVAGAVADSAGLNAAGTPEFEARQRLLKHFPKALLRGDYVARTQFASVWAIRNAEKTLPRYFAGELNWTINVPEPYGFLTFKEFYLSKPQFDVMRKTLASQIDLKPWFLVKGKTRPTLVVYSAWDCPYSRKMEADMRRAGISYYLIPSGLTAQSKALAERIYATPEFDRQWQELLTRGAISGRPGVQARPYPEEMATDLAFLFKTSAGVPAPAPATPLFVFRDGRSGEGWSSERSLPLVRKATSYF